MEDNLVRQTVLVRAVDGDSIWANVDMLRLGQKALTMSWEIRLTICNTPEKGQPGYQEAKDFTSQFSGQTVRIVIAKFEKYGRLLADVYVTYKGEIRSLSELLIKEGYAVPYLV